MRLHPLPLTDTLPTPAPVSVAVPAVALVLTVATVVASLPEPPETQLTIQLTSAETFFCVLLDKLASALSAKVLPT